MILKILKAWFEDIQTNLGCDKIQRLDRFTNGWCLTRLTASDTQVQELRYTDESCNLLKYHLDVSTIVAEKPILLRSLLYEIDLSTFI